MEAVVAQKKDSDKATKATAQATPDPRSQEAEGNGAGAGVPLYLQARSESQPAAGSPPSRPSRRVQRQATEAPEEFIG